MKTLRRPVPVKHAVVQNLDGEMVSTADRADALVDYFEQVQWRNPLPDAELLNRPSLGNELPIMLSEFHLAELQTVLSKLKRGRSAGLDDIPPDFWAAIKDHDDVCLALLALCQQCWDEKNIPASWRRATVVLLFKKGDATLPQNYRPISLLDVGYKVLASFIHQRLLLGGTEQRMHSSQYGFRPRRGTADALMVIRRMIDATFQRNQKQNVFFWIRQSV